MGEKENNLSPCLLMVKTYSSFHLLFRILLDKWLVYSTKYLAESRPCVTIKEWMTVEKN